MNVPTLYCVVPYVVACVDVSGTVLSEPSTRMHSSRMHTVCCSGRLGGVSAQGMSGQGGVCLGGCLPRRGCLPHRRGVCLSQGVSVQGVFA